MVSDDRTSSLSASWTEWWDPPNPATRAGEARVRQYISWINGLGAVYLERASDIANPQLLKTLLEFLVPDCVLPRQDHTCHAPRRCKDGTVLDDNSSLLEDCMMVIWEKGGAPPAHATEDLYSISDIQRQQAPAIATLLHGLFKTFVLSEIVPQLLDMVLWYNKILAPYFKELSKPVSLLLEAAVNSNVTCTEILDSLFDDFYDCSMWLCCFHSHCQPAYVLNVCTVYWKADSKRPTELLANAGFTFSLFEQYNIVPLYTLREYMKNPHPEFIVLQSFVIWQVLQKYPPLTEVNLRALDFLDQSSLFRAARLAEEQKAKLRQREHELAMEHQKSQLVQCESPHRSTYLGVLRQHASLDKEEADLKRPPPPVRSLQSFSPRRSATPENHPSYKVSKTSVSENVTKMLQVMVNNHQNDLLQLPISDRTRRIVSSMKTSPQKKKRSTSTSTKTRKTPSSSSVPIVSQAGQPRWRGPSARLMTPAEASRLELLKKSRSIPKLSRPVAPRSRSSVNYEKAKKEKIRLQERPVSPTKQKPDYRPIPKLRTSPPPPETPHRAVGISPPSWKDTNDISAVLDSLISHDKSPAYRANVFSDSSPGGGIFSPFAQDSINNTKQQSASPRSVSVNDTRDVRSTTPHLVSASVQPAHAVDNLFTQSMHTRSRSGSPLSASPVSPVTNEFPSNPTASSKFFSSSDVHSSPLQPKQVSTQRHSTGNEEITLSSGDHQEAPQFGSNYVDSPKGLPLSPVSIQANDKLEQQDKRSNIHNTNESSSSSAHFDNSIQQLAQSGAPSDVTTAPGINVQPMPSNSTFSVSAWSGSPLYSGSVKTLHLEGSKPSYFQSPLSDGPILNEAVNQKEPNPNPFPQQEGPSWLPDQGFDGVLVADLASVRRRVGSVSPTPTNPPRGASDAFEFQAAGTPARRVFLSPDQSPQLEISEVDRSPAPRQPHTPSFVYSGTTLLDLFESCKDDAQAQRHP